MQDEVDTGGSTITPQLPASQLGARLHHQGKGASGGLVWGWGGVACSWERPLGPGEGSWAAWGGRAGQRMELWLHLVIPGPCSNRAQRLGPQEFCQFGGCIQPLVARNSVVHPSGWWELGGGRWLVGPSSYPKGL